MIFCKIKYFNHKSGCLFLDRQTSMFNEAVVKSNYILKVTILRESLLLFFSVTLMKHLLNDPLSRSFKKFS